MSADTRSLEFNSVARSRGLFRLGPLDLQVPAGAWATIRGPSGSGKTTLLQLAAGLERADSGRVMLSGEDLTDAPEGRLAALRRRVIGFVFQEPRFIAHLSVAENVALGLVPEGLAARERRARASAALERLGLADVAGRRPEQLSGGERQRVAIARATIHGPRLLLADEPTASVDEATGALVLAYLRELHARGATVLVSTHDPAASRYADLALQIQNGQLVP